MSNKRSRQHTTMKQATAFFTFIAALFVTTSCSDELFIDEPTTFIAEGELVEVDLDLSVADLSIEMTTRTEVPDTEGERKINDIWVFQYDYSSGNIIQANYYTISDQDELDDLKTVHAWLSTNSQNPCIIYVVANTSDGSWAANAKASTSSGFYTLDELKKQTIPNPAPIRIDDGTKSVDDLSIPMSGSVGEDGTIVIRGEQNERITIPVTRMFAKLYVKVNLKSNDYDASMTSMIVDNIPDFSTVETVYDNGSWYYPTSSAGSVFDVSRTFTMSEDVTPDDDGTKSYGEFVLYVPENLQGTSTTEAIKITPYLNVQVNIEDSNGEKATITSRPSYTAYPGSWDDTIESEADENTGSGKTTEYGENTNIKRNNIYDITLTIGISETDLITPSANCLIAEPGETIAFFPYVRDEQPSEELQEESNYASTLEARYDFTTYLNSSYTQGSQDKKIKSVKIIWQYPQGFIGNNSGFDLVTIDPEPDDEDNVVKSYNEYRRKIYVKTKSAGNALIAAYDGYNGTGNILWSWHIWAPNEGVHPEEGAIEYYHLKWNHTSGVETGNYEPGPLVMNLNLGALAEKPAGSTYDFDTFGTHYQWGRKDPFPPGRTTSGGAIGLSYMTPCYDNNNDQIVLTDNDGTLAATSNTDLFYTNAPSNVSGGTLSSSDDDAIIKQTILHPTMFVASTTEAAEQSSAANYYNEGDWLPVKDDFLWGGGHTSTTTEYQVYSTDTGSDKYNSHYKIDAYLEDDFGPEKTIFDPCPYGWRVSNGDLWLGFTSDGKNWSVGYDDGNDTNIVEKNEYPDDYLDITYAQRGHTYYMQGWHGSLGSATSFFPIQGIRTAGGAIQSVCSCGNYHNSTVDRVVTLSGGNIRRVDILHEHTFSSGACLTYPYEVSIYFYNKTLAAPLRCIRDTK